MNELDYYWSMFDVVKDNLARHGINDIDLIRKITENEINKKLASRGVDAPTGSNTVTEYQLNENSKSLLD